MRHLGRVHGVTVAWLHEQYTGGLFEMVYEPSSTMAADIFTKGFTNPDAWRAVCRLVSVVSPEEVNEFCCSLGAPLPPSQGGGKSGKTGEWQLNADGSGKWVRWDRGATRFSTLYSSGPARQEVYERVTFDSNTGETFAQRSTSEQRRRASRVLPERRMLRWWQQHGGRVLYGRGLGAEFA